MKSNGLIYLVFIFMLTACNQNDSFYMEAASANGLSIGSGIYVDALQIGKIEDVMVSDEYKVVFKAGVNRGLKIPKNSKFKNVLNHDLNERIIEIELGNGYELLSPQDTVMIKKHLHEIVDSLVETVKTTLFDKIKDKVNEQFEDE